MITATGAVIGLAIVIVLIVKKFNPAYSLILGSLIGGLLGGAGLVETVNFMIKGAQGMMPAILRIITAGILAGVLIETGAANKIAETIVDKLGENKAIFALVISTFVLTAVGVFVDISVITVSPIAIALAKRVNISKTSILIAMIGGGKSGNIISPNPNAIAASESFGIPLTSVMFSGLIPAIVGIIITVIIAGMMSRKGVKILDSDVEVETGVKEKPAFLAAIAGPVCAILLLALRPIANIVIDPLIALPIGGLIGCIAMGKIKNIDLINNVIKNSGNNYPLEDTWKDFYKKEIKDLIIRRCEESPTEYLVYGSYMTDSKKQYQEVGKTYFRNQFNKIMEAFGMEHTPHDTRRTLATKLYKSGMKNKDIIDIMGHTEITTTENYYVCNDEEELKEAMDKVDLLN